MSHRFDISVGSVTVNAHLLGVGQLTIARLLLDTGASRTILSKETLELIGCLPEISAATIEIVTASGHERLSEVEVPVFAAFDVQRLRFKVIAHSLPSAVGFDGVLGIDFLRDHLLTIDFRRGLIDLL